jgi:hypothetical protein
MGNSHLAYRSIRDREQHPEVLWQEAAEMVAWIMSDVNSRQCPLEIILGNGYVNLISRL